MHIQNNPIQNSPKNHERNKKQSNKKARLKVAGGHAAAITGTNFRIEFYTLLASSQHVGMTAAVTILLFVLFEHRTIFGLPALTNSYLFGQFF